MKKILKCDSTNDARVSKRLQKVRAKEEQMTAARTKQHEQEKPTGIRTGKKTKRRKQGQNNKFVLTATI